MICSWPHLLRFGLCCCEIDGRLAATGVALVIVAIRILGRIVGALAFISYKPPMYLTTQQNRKLNINYTSILWLSGS